MNQGNIGINFTYTTGSRQPLHLSSQGAVNIWLLRVSTRESKDPSRKETPKAKYQLRLYIHFWKPEGITTLMVQYLINLVPKGVKTFQKQTFPKQASCNGLHVRSINGTGRSSYPNNITEGKKKGKKRYSYDKFIMYFKGIASWT